DRSRGQQGDKREGDEQRDDESRGLPDLQPDSAPRQELERTQAEARGARLRERDVQSVWVSNPEEQLVRRVRPGAPEHAAEAVRDVEPRTADEGERDVVRLDRDPDHPQRVHAADQDLGTWMQAPGTRDAALDERLPRRTDVPSLDDGVPARPGSHALERRRVA